MAINHSFKVQRVEVYPSVDDQTQPTMMVVEEHLFDDPDDNQLPVTSSKVYHLDETSDVTNRLPIIQALYNSVITYVEPTEDEVVEEPIA